jgi:Barstar (barnase inhibitor)
MFHAGRNRTAAIDSRFGLGPVHDAPLTEDLTVGIPALARTLGFDCTRVDLAGCTEKREFLARVARALGFPARFGPNWDGFADAVTDLSWRPAPGYVLILEHTRELQEIEPEVFDTALAILSDAGSVWHARGAELHVFVSP